MRWARDVIAPLLVASVPQQALCFSAGRSNLQSAVFPRRLPADSSHGEGTPFLAARLPGRCPCREQRHEHQARGVSARCDPQLMTASKPGADMPVTATTAVTAASVPPTPTTRYTIDVGVHPDAASLAVKHALRLPRFLEHYPISSHTKVAYGEAVAFVREFHLVRHGSSTSGATSGQRQEKEKQQQRQQVRHSLPVVLDSGCGTGRSSVLLAKSHPDLPVVGVDRSAVRLSKRGGIAGREGSAQGRHRDGPGDQEGEEQVAAGDDVDVCNAGSEEGSRHPREGTRRPGEPLPENLLLLRADLVDLWILASRDDAWEVREHFILYPNPYPKRSQLRSRWHGHPVFPVLLGLGGRITLRSNWKSYLDEVCQAVLAINDESGKETEPGRAGSDDEGAGTGMERVESGVTRRDSEGAASPGLALSGEGGDEKGEISGELGGGITQGTPVDSIGAIDAVDAAAALPSGGIPVAVATAAASYAASARTGPSFFKPAVPASTNFEAKYVAVGETVYELRLEPQTDESVESA